MNLGGRPRSLEPDDDDDDDDDKKDARSIDVKNVRDENVRNAVDASEGKDQVSMLLIDVFFASLTNTLAYWLLASMRKLKTPYHIDTRANGIKLFLSVTFLIS